MTANSLTFTDIHPVLSEVTKFGTFEDNLNLKCAWGKYAFANKSELNELMNKADYEKFAKENSN